MAALVCLAIAPAAGAEDGMILPDPVVMAATLVNASLASVTMPPLAVTLPAEPPAATVPEAVAAAAEPIPAQEPQPTPPPPQPQVPDPATAPEELSPPPEPVPAQVEQPQYQSAPPQYQPAAAPAPPAPPTAAASPPPPPAEPVEAEGSWNWTWSCGGSVQPPAVLGDDLPNTWNWNWDWNCGADQSTEKNSAQESRAQYQPAIAQYHPVNVNLSIRVASPGDDGPVTQTNVVVVVEAKPAVATPETPASALAPPPAPPPEAAAPDSDAPLPTTGSDRKAEPKVTLASARQNAAPAEAPSWTARSATPRRLQPTNQEAHRNRQQPRRPTRRPLPPQRAPMIPVSSLGAAPLGGSDGGGFQLALLLVPFAFALVDSARRVVRDTAPPVGRGHKKRRKRPG